ncbi:MAG: hypothetical protein AB7S78_09680 [Candidatus Omnitrophota bacterium]
MKKLSSIFGCFLFISFVFFARNLRAECPPPEINELFEKKESLGDIMLYAVPEAEQNFINHIKYIYNRLLVRDDKGGGKIRQEIVKANPTVILMEDGDDLDELYRDYGRILKNCPMQEFLIVEIIPLGTEAERLGVKDVTIEEMLNLVYQYGIYKAFPSWSSRLRKSMSRAITAGTFNPYLVDPEQPRKYWEVSYLGIGLEVYYNMWDKQQTVKEGGFAFNSRETLKQGDPELFQLIEEIFPDKLYQ